MLRKSWLWLAEKYNFTGVEIDYEQIRDNLSLWKKFLVFEKALYPRTKKAGLDLRIVLEPSTPVSKINFPKGPEYVVMCYNLYGYGTNPGPKADYKFLKKTVKDFSSLGQDPGQGQREKGWHQHLADGIKANSKEKTS